MASHQTFSGGEIEQVLGSSLRGCACVSAPERSEAARSRVNLVDRISNDGPAKTGHF